MDYITIDFEASCLPRHGLSFPIEVGIADASGTQTWLIRPDAGWRSWDWTQEALDLHGITPAMLDAQGLPVDQVFAELNQAIAGRRIVADSRMDNYWWRLLACAAGEADSCPIMQPDILLDHLGASSDDVFAAQRVADERWPARHRAADDARWLWILLAELHRMSAAGALSGTLRTPRSAGQAAQRDIGLAA